MLSWRPESIMCAFMLMVCIKDGEQFSKGVKEALFTMHKSATNME